MTAPRSASKIGFIFATILLDAMGIGLIIPVLPDVLRRFSTDPATVSAWFGAFIGAYALMQFLASPVLGSLSDRYGRKPILLISLLGAALDYVFMAFAPTLPLLFIGRLISGLTGASMTVASSYMADISDDRTRSANFGMIGAGWGIGFILGPLIGGLLSTAGPTAPFLASAGLNLVNFLFGVFVLPESLPQEMRRNVELKKLNPFRSLVKILRPSPFSTLVYVYFLLFLAGNVHPVNWTLYTQTKFGWSAWEVGLSLSFVGIMIAIAQGGLTRIIIPKLGEERSLRYGIIVNGLAFFLFGVATRGWMMIPIVAFMSLSGVAMPALQSIVAKHVPPNEQGELQGSLVSVGSLATILSPLFFTSLFVHFTDEAGIYFPGAAYIGAAFICLIAWILQIPRRTR